MDIIKNILTPQIAQLSLGVINQIEKITHGLSQQCFKITLDKSGELTQYIAKVYTTGNVEEQTEFQTYQSLGALYHEELGFAKLAGHSSHVLMFSTLEGSLLSSLTLSDSVKRTLAIEAMSLFHELSLSLFPFAKSLNLHRVLNELLNEVELTDAFRCQVKSKITSTLADTQEINNTKKTPNVLCHGDINFANVIIDKGEQGSHDSDESYKSSLIDFESLCKMSPEYDIGMMLAVNEIGMAECDNVIASYLQKRTPEVPLSKTLISHYYTLSSLINGLWYLGRYQLDKPDITLGETKVKVYLSKAKKQFGLANIFMK